MWMAEVKTLLPLELQQSTSELATPHALAALDALWPRTNGMGRPKATTLGQLAGFQPSGPL
jgi:hypothetical protein